MMMHDIKRFQLPAFYRSFLLTHDFQTSISHHSNGKSLFGEGGPLFQGRTEQPAIFYWLSDIGKKQF